MNTHDKTNEHLDSLLGEALGDTAVPDMGPSVWFEIRSRTTSSRVGGWIPRFAMMTAAAACMAVGIFAGAEWIPGGSTAATWLTPDEVVVGSLWDETVWSLDGLYTSVETMDTADGGAR